MATQAIGLSISFPGEEAAKVLTDNFTPIERQWSAQVLSLNALERRQAGRRQARPRTRQRPNA